LHGLNHQEVHVLDFDTMDTMVILHPVKSC